jgi:DNA modification methylase
MSIGKRCKKHYRPKKNLTTAADISYNFSQKGDVVLDPFGGSGVTAVEALFNVSLYAKRWRWK